jgi:geranylgeranyl reductase family protein
MARDVAIVGGGPAGLYAAQLLARQGLDVCVVEEHARVGVPVHCTGILGTEALALPGVPREAVLGWPTAARFHSPSGLQLDYAVGPGEVCVVDRGAFDRGLEVAAVQAGANVVTGTRVLQIAIGPSGVLLRTEAAGRRDTLGARICLLACGASYRLQRSLGWGVPPLYLTSAQMEVPATGGERLEIFLRPELSPIGFGWLAPLERAGERRAKVGVMASRGAASVLGRLVTELTAEDRLVGVPGTPVVRLLPLGPLGRTFGSRVLAIGDAAGLVKPTTGGGIYYSLLSASWAAETVSSAFARGDFTERALAAYEELWRGRLGRELRVGLWFRRLAGRLTPGDLDALTELAITDGVMPVVRRTARFNWHRRMILQTLRHPGVLQIVLRRLFGADACAAGP